MYIIFSNSHVPNKSLISHSRENYVSYGSHITVLYFYEVNTIIKKPEDGDFNQVRMVK